MIVDDHPEMRRLLRSTLKALSTDIRECVDGYQAVATFALQRPDWTIMDVGMKGMDGLEATRRIKALFPEARILILTQHDSPGIQRAAQDAGAAAFLSKDQLLDIEHVLTTPPGGPAESSSNEPQEI